MNVRDPSKRADANIAALFSGLPRGPLGERMQGRPTTLRGNSAAWLSGQPFQYGAPVRKVARIGTRSARTNRHAYADSFTCDYDGASAPRD